jgi:hypothetical protein
MPVTLAASETRSLVSRRPVGGEGVLGQHFSKGLARHSGNGQQGIAGRTYSFDHHSARHIHHQHLSSARAKDEFGRADPASTVASSMIFLATIYCA